jgi:hypothetical protein
MAETLGSLCDKLTIVKLKQYHTKDIVRLESLGKQELSLQNEINEFIKSALNGTTPIDKLTFSSNKVYKKEGNEIQDIKGSIGVVFGKLAETNCHLWHEQEKVYEFELVPAEEKNIVVRKLALLNLERNKCIDEIDNSFKDMISNRK